jgi:hypothetical protein
MNQHKSAPEQPTTEAIHAISAAAQAVLGHNDRGPFITPSDQLYGAGGNNWGYLWDTAFSTMAMAEYDPMRASELFTNFLSTQHSSGRVPHMSMWSSNFPVGTIATNWNWHGRHFKQIDSLGNMVKTSPITQPPILATAALDIFDCLEGDSQKHQFLQTVTPRLVAYHEWLYAEREWNKTGLVIAIHPHETGRDDAPSHTALLAAVPLGLREKAFLSKAVRHLFVSHRTDKEANLDERSDIDTIMKASALAIFGLPKVYRTGKIPADYPYQHIDPGFNAILDRSNDALQTLCDLTGNPISPHLQEAMHRTRQGMNRLWHPAAAGYAGIDVNQRVSFTPGHEVGDILPIVSPATRPHQRRALVAQITDPRQFGGDNLPSVSRSSADYDPRRFWRGPSWPPTRVLEIRGLSESGNPAEKTLAYNRCVTLLTTAIRHGFSEYTDGTDGTPKGADYFSWSAAMVITASTYVAEYQNQNVA